jgi:hypothetical protein
MLKKYKKLATAFTVAEKNINKKFPPFKKIRKKSLLG